MRARWTADEAALKARPFPILGLAPPFPSPLSLGSLETVNGQISNVGLRYGGSEPSSGPLVLVCTAPAAGDRASLSVIDVLRELTGDAADDESPPSGRAAPEAAEILIDGVPNGARTIDSDIAWAAIVKPHVDHIPLLVTVAAREWPLSGLALTQVDDLEPFLAGRRERVEAALARAGSQPGPEDWDLPAAAGLSGHRALADMMIASTRETMAAGHRLRQSRLAGDYAQRWEVATRAQMALAGQRRDEAEDAIHSMINHLCQLAQSADWFADVELEDKAIAETLDYFAYGRDVPSAEAQRAWSRYWDLHGQQPPPFESLSSAQESWLAAWRRWADRR
jgi:hypothetical protein